MNVDHWNSHGGDETVVIEYAPDEGAQTSIAIVHAIAALEDADPTDVTINLSDHLDPEALDRLTAHSGSGHPWIAFTMNGYSVQVHDTGTIAVREPD